LDGLANAIDVLGRGGRSARMRVDACVCVWPAARNLLESPRGPRDFDASVFWNAFSRHRSLRDRQSPGLQAKDRDALGARLAMTASSSGTGPSADDTLVVVELPPEAKLVPNTPLEFSGLGTKHPRVRLPNGVELVGRYEESVGSLLILDKESEDGTRLEGKSETRLIFASGDGGTTTGRQPRSGR
jgi:hypothetical protein